MEINALTSHEQALKFRALRNQVLSSNIANADTPGYKARDLDFGSALNAARQGTLKLAQTSELHAKAWNTSRHGGELMYRVPMQPSLDGNTVETDVEQAAFAENALQYRTSLSFVDSHFRKLKFAIKGGD